MVSVGVLFFDACRVMPIDAIFVAGNHAKRAEYAAKPCCSGEYSVRRKVFYAGKAAAKPYNAVPVQALT